MTYEQLIKANESIKTTDIKGKEYAEVNQRIKAFRMLFPLGFIKTQIVSLENGTVTMTAEVGRYDENGNELVLGCGTAQEKENSSFINKVSFIENCETSAVGRAMGMLGIGIDTSVASYEEVANAIENQNKKLTENEVKALTLLAAKKGVTAEKLCKRYKVNELNELTEKDYLKAVKGLEEMDDVQGTD